MTFLGLGFFFLLNLKMLCWTSTSSDSSASFSETKLKFKLSSFFPPLFSGWSLTSDITSIKSGWLVFIYPSSIYIKFLIIYSVFINDLVSNFSITPNILKFRFSNLSISGIRITWISRRSSSWIKLAHSIDGIFNRHIWVLNKF